MNEDYFQSLFVIHIYRILPFRSLAVSVAATFSQLLRLKWFVQRLQMLKNHMGQGVLLFFFLDLLLCVLNILYISGFRV